MTTTLQAALAYARRGIPVFPCAPGAKIPFAGSSGSKDATTDERQITEWWGRMPTANVAIATGKASGLYVVDIDDDGSEIMPLLPPTLTARTRGGGWHYVYRLDDGEGLPNTNKRASNALAPDTDTRGDGGYVLVWPSVVVEDGVEGRYQWIDPDAEIAPLPQWVRSKVRPPRAEVAPQTRQTFAAVSSGYGRKALDEETAKVAGTGEGGRNESLHRAACRLGQLVGMGHLGRHEAADALLSAGLHAGLREHEAKRTIVSGMTWGSSHPRQAVQPRLRPAMADPLGGAEIVLHEAGVQAVRGEGEGGQGDVVAQVARERAAAVATSRQEAQQGDEWREGLLAMVRDLGGLCDSFPAWVLRGADHPQPMLAVGAAVALGAVLAARRLNFRGALSTTYVVHIGESASGKDRPQRCLSRALDECWPGTVGGSSWSSSVAWLDMLRRATDAGHGLVSVLDEYGMQLTAMLGGRSAHRQDLKHYLTELATLGPRTWSPAVSLVRGGGRLELAAPCPVLLGSTTPTSAAGALSGADVADGFVGRHLWLPTQAVLPQWQPPETRGDDALPTDVRAAIAAIRERHEAWHLALPCLGAGSGAQADVDLRAYDPIAMPETQEAGRDLLELKLACDAARRSGETGGIPAPVVGRLPEHASRLAMILAALSQPEEAAPAVHAAHVAAGRAIAEESARTLGEQLLARQRADRDDHGGQIDLVLGALARLGGEATRRDLLRACRSLRARDLGEIVERLAQEGELVVDQEQTGGGPRVLLRLVKGV